jgi:hypothetical protein
MRLARGPAWSTLALLGAFCLSGCATPNGPTVEAFAKTAGPPKAGQARVIVYREPLYAYQVWDRNYPVKLDGEPMAGNLTAGTFVSLDRPAGHHQLSLDVWDLPGVTRVDFNAVAGRTHYFVVRMSDRGKVITAGTVFGGLSGYALAAVVTSGDDKGGMDLISVDEATAKKALAELRQGE